MLAGSPVRNARGKGRLRRLARAMKVIAGVGRVRRSSAVMSWSNDDEVSIIGWQIYGTDVAYMSAMAVPDVRSIHGVCH